MPLTKQVVISGTVAASATDQELGTLTCPSGYERRIVEIRTYIEAAGSIKCTRKDETIYEDTYSVAALVAHPHAVDILLAAGIEFTVYGTDTSGSDNDMAVTLLWEETPVG